MQLSEKQFEDMKKEIFMNLKMSDITIKGITDTAEYREHCAYNKGIRETFAIINKYYHNLVN